MIQSEADHQNTSANKGCRTIGLILLAGFITTGIFFIIAGKLVGPENRHILFFGGVGTVVICFLIKELLINEKRKPK